MARLLLFSAAWVLAVIALSGKVTQENSVRTIWYVVGLLVGAVLGSNPAIQNFLNK